MAWDDWVFGIPTAGGYNAAKWGVKKLTDPSPGELDERQRKELLAEQAAKSGGFADSGERGFGQLGQDARARMDYLQRVASGEHSIAGEQLRQGTQALQAQQRSMAAAAAPRDAAASAHAAALNSARLGYGMSGQAALAGLQERRDAESALANMINQQRQQELMAALQGRGTAVTGYGAGNAGQPERSRLDKLLPAIQSTGTMMAGMK
jgi:hypothetical protein